MKSVKELILIEEIMTQKNTANKSNEEINAPAQETKTKRFN